MQVDEVNAAEAALLKNIQLMDGQMTAAGSSMQFCVSHCRYTNLFENLLFYQSEPGVRARVDLCFNQMHPEEEILSGYFDLAMDID